MGTYCDDNQNQLAGLAHKMPCAGFTIWFASFLDELNRFKIVQSRLRLLLNRR